MHNERCTSGSEGGPKKPGGRKADRALRSDPIVTRMAAAAERRDLLDANAASGIAFPPLKRRIRPIPPDKAAEAWLARFRALAGPDEERLRRGVTSGLGAGTGDVEPDSGSPEGAPDAPGG